MKQYSYVPFQCDGGEIKLQLPILDSLLADDLIKLGYRFELEKMGPEVTEVRCIDPQDDLVCQRKSYSDDPKFIQSVVVLILAAHTLVVDKDTEE